MVRYITKQTWQAEPNFGKRRNQAVVPLTKFSWLAHPYIQNKNNPASFIFFWIENFEIVERAFV